MRQQIFELLNRHLIYPDVEISEFITAGRIRFDCTPQQFQNDIKKIIDNKDNLLEKLLFRNEQLPVVAKGLFKLDSSAQISELKRLDFNCLHSFLNGEINPEIKKYLLIFAEEVRHPKLCSPSLVLANTEFEMFQYIMKQPFEEEREKLRDIANRTIRVMLQEWLLYPELISDKDEAGILMEALYCSNIEL